MGIEARYNIYMNILTKQIAEQYNFSVRSVTDLHIPVNDVLKVETNVGTYALKIYHKGRTVGEVHWEAKLLRHLESHDVPIIPMIPANDGYLSSFDDDRVQRIGILYEWSDGQKPQPSTATYRLLGDAAARIHAALNDFSEGHDRQAYDTKYLIDVQIERMRKDLEDIGLYDDMLILADKMRSLLSSASLDQGVCHMDLKPDNVHILNGDLKVFDFDSAGWSWRAIEPYRVLIESKDYFEAWIDSYRTIRSFSDEDVAAVKAFTVIAKIRDVVWDLGRNPNSREKPQLNSSDLVGIIGDWKKTIDTMS